MASFDVAVATGFLFAAARPAHARALLPVGLALSALLLVTSATDVVGGTAVVAHEANHLLAVVQAGLLWALARSRGPAARPAPARAT
jgi:hypothetical protein